MGDAPGRGDLTSHDRLFGGYGEHTVIDGIDRLHGGPANDEVRANVGPDVTSGGLDDDVSHGGLGNDVIFANQGRSTAARATTVCGRSPGPT